MATPIVGSAFEPLAPEPAAGGDPQRAITPAALAQAGGGPPSEVAPEDAGERDSPAPTPARHRRPGWFRAAALAALVLVATAGALAWRGHHRAQVLAQGMAQARGLVLLDTWGGYRGAADLLEPLTRMDPLEAGALRAFALAMLASDYRDDRAAEAAKRLLVEPERAAEVPEFARLAHGALALRGDQLRRQRNYDAAHAAYASALERSPTHPRAAFGLGKLALGGHAAPGEAMAALQRLVDDHAGTGSSERGRAALHLAALQARAGDRTAAYHTLDGAGLDPAARTWAEKAAGQEELERTVYRVVEGAPPALQSASDDDVYEPPPPPPTPAPKAEPRSGSKAASHHRASKAKLHAGKSRPEKRHKAQQGKAAKKTRKVANASPRKHAHPARPPA